MVEEMWPRYGSFPGWNPFVELSLSFHNLVVGANGQRQAMFLENVSVLAARILRNFDLSSLDSALVISSSGCNVVPIEMAEGFRQRGIRVVGEVMKYLTQGTGMLTYAASLVAASEKVLPESATLRQAIEALDAAAE